MNLPIRRWFTTGMTLAALGVQVASAETPRDDAAAVFAPLITRFGCDEIDAGRKEDIAFLCESLMMFRRGKEANWLKEEAIFIGSASLIDDKGRRGESQTWVLRLIEDQARAFRVWGDNRKEKQELEDLRTARTSGKPLPHNSAFEFIERYAFSLSADQSEPTTGRSLRITTKEGAFIYLRRSGEGWAILRNKPLLVGYLE